MERFNSRVTRRIRAELGRRGITQHQLAGWLGWHQARLSRRLTDQVSWSTDDIEAVAKVLNVPPWQLIAELIA